jgi:hypothetical protein
MFPISKHRVAGEIGVEPQSPLQKVNFAGLPTVFPNLDFADQPDEPVERVGASLPSGHRRPEQPGTIRQAAA